MMKNRCMAAAVILSMLLLFTGCQLAKPELALVQGGDKLCGVFIAESEAVYELMDRMDNGKQINVDISKLKKNANGEYIGELIPSRRCIVEGVEAVGKDGTRTILEFPGLKGEYIGFLTGNFDNGEGYISNNCSEGIYNDEFSANVSDQGVEDKYTATMVVGSKFDVKIKPCLIYERSDGSFYVDLNSAAGLWLTAGLSGAGYTISNEYRMDKKGALEETRLMKRTFGITIERTDYMIGAVIKEMDVSDRVIKQTSMDFNDPISELQIGEAVAYVIVEEQLLDSEGKEYRKRTAYDCENIEADGKNYMETEAAAHNFYFTGNGDGIIKPYAVQFVR